MRKVEEFLSIEKFTTQILKDKQPVATGVFIKYLEKYFILSTAHQYWGNDNATFQFSYQGQYFDQLGFHYYIKQDEIEIKDFDFSLLEMSLERYNFIDHNHFYNLDLSTLDTIDDNSKNVLFGYRSKAKKEGDKIRPDVLVYYFKYIEPSNPMNPFFYVKYPRRKMTRNGHNRSMAPIPVGCSGCGIWNFGMDEPVLLGILQEYNSSKAEIKIIKLPVITKFINKHVNKV